MRAMQNSGQIYPKVSFIIPTLNAEWILPKCLEAIRNQNYPQNKVEIVIADGGSTDKTLEIAKKYKAVVIKNPEVLHEPGKTRAAKKATGDILFFTDSDNILSHKRWIMNMIQPYLEKENIIGFLPQTIPAPDSNSLDQYLGYLCTDPFTWFIYNGITSGRDFPQKYIPIEKTKNYVIYRFSPYDPPLFGLSQGTGAHKKFQRNKKSYADDLLAGIQMMKERKLIAYVYNSGVYHYHIDGFSNFIKKYRWRIRNNLIQQVKGMGILNRTSYFSKNRQMRMYLFIPYGLSVILPLFDSVKFIIKYRDRVMIWHVICTFILACLMVEEYMKIKLLHTTSLGTYE